MSYTKQVKLDLVRTPLSPSQQTEIAKRISLLLTKYPHLHYYQGFHDVALNTPDFERLEYLALVCLRDFMTPTMAQTLAVIELIPQLLLELDPSFKIIAKVPPHYALAPVLTLFAHDTDDCKDILEAVANRGIAYILYFYAAVVLLSKPDIYKELQGETEPDMVQAIMTRASVKVSQHSRTLLHKKAQEYISAVPIDSLAGFAAASRWSALNGIEDLAEAEHASKKLAEPASYMGIVTVGIVVAAVLLQWATAR